MSVSLLLPDWNETNIGISPFLEELSFLNSLRHPGTLVHYFHIIVSFLHVCQSVSWLTSLVKLGKYRDISSSGWDIFLTIFGDIPGMLVHILQIFLNSVSWLTSLLKLDKYRDISRSGWDIFLIFLEIFLGCWYTSSK